MFRILLNSRIVQVIFSALGFIGGIILYGSMKKREGATQVREELVQQDVQTAIRIRKQADKDLADVKKDVDKLSTDAVNDGLHKHGKLRD